MDEYFPICSLCFGSGYTAMVTDKGPEKIACPCKSEPAPVCNLCQGTGEVLMIVGKEPRLRGERVRARCVCRHVGPVIAAQAVEKVPRCLPSVMAYEVYTGLWIICEVGDSGAPAFLEHHVRCEDCARSLYICHHSACGNRCIGCGELNCGGRCAHSY